ncbi:ATP-dependent zinc metalloprotease FtsH [Alphaproteobacteria bacterium]|nr:ATP-dependent zinc metalloprotease FtsH [Alphaproteobacteria bacterium]GHS96968.1 ATP-dependent zinc metalloprotease FtsH [Alphaproteobacteria bacterium]
MKPNSRNFLIWALVLGGIFAGVHLLTRQENKLNENRIPYSQFVQSVRSGKVAEVRIQGPDIFGKTRRGENFVTYAPFSPTLIQDLLDNDVVIDVQPKEQEFSFWQFILPWLPILLLCSLIFYSMRQFQSNGSKAMGFGKSNAKKADDKRVKITFDDVAGVDEAKEELQEIVSFLKDPQKFQRLGGKIPKGLLLVGPPGTGKTLLAKAIAGESGVPFFSMAGSGFVEMFVGVGASRVRDLFGQAKKNSPCIIFIDEIDAVGRRRSTGFGNDEREQTLNQLLVEMDGFENSLTIIVIAATNRPDVLDHALLRPGRFDRRVVVPNPDIKGREKILAVHLKNVPLAPHVALEILARGTPGFSGADLANLVNEAALLAARNGKLAVSMKDLEEAKDKVMMGAERRSMVLTDESKKMTAYHEAGHAVVSFFTPGADPLHKATIIPRGEALGMVVSLPEGDQTSLTYESLIAGMTMSMGGRIAEEMIFGPTKITTGASSDIRSATNLARRMVMDWGMSERLGVQTCFVGDYYETKEFSEATSQIIDEEVRKLLDRCYKKAEAVLTEHRAQLDALANAMLERETLTGEEIRLVCEGKALPPFKLFKDESEDAPGLPNVVRDLPKPKRRRKSGEPKPENKGTAKPKRKKKDGEKK